jgi:hypothetical protein
MECTHILYRLQARSSLLRSLDVLTPFNPPLYFVKRGKLYDIQLHTPPLCEAERGTGGEFIGSRYRGRFIRIQGESLKLSIKKRLLLLKQPHKKEVNKVSNTKLISECCSNSVSCGCDCCRFEVTRVTIHKVLSIARQHCTTQIEVKILLPETNSK